MMYKDALCKFQRPEEWGAKSGVDTDSPMKSSSWCGGAEETTSLHREGGGANTPSMTLNSLETGSVTNSVHTSRFDDMDSWVDDDQCFYDSLKQDLAKAQQAVHEQARAATWKKVEGPGPHRPTSRHNHGGGGGGRGAKHGKNTGVAQGGGSGWGSNDRGVGSKNASRSGQGSRSDNSAFIIAATVAPVSAGRFDALAPPTTKRFR